MGRTLDVARNQLFSRPDDECFPTWEALFQALQKRTRQTEEVDVTQDSIAATDSGGALVLAAEGTRYRLNDWSFQQLCELSGAPAQFINRLPADLAATVLNRTRELFGDQSGEGRLLAQRERPGHLARALYSRDYTRVPDLEVAELVQREATGFVPAGEVAGRHVGMPPVRPERSGLYAGPRDLWVFLVDEDNVIDWRPPQNGGSQPMYRFLIVANSEVRARKVTYLMGLMQGICGNHLIWDAEEVLAGERRHVGEKATILDQVRRAIEALRNRQSIRQDLRVLEAAATAFFAHDQEEVVEKLYPKYCTREIAQRALQSAISDFQATPPFTVWEIVQGLTRASQATGFNDVRTTMDRAAGKLLAAVAPK